MIFVETNRGHICADRIILLFWARGAQMLEYDTGNGVETAKVLGSDAREQLNNLTAVVPAKPGYKKLRLSLDENDNAEVYETPVVAWRVSVAGECGHWVEPVCPDDFWSEGDPFVVEMPDGRCFNSDGDYRSRDAWLAEQRKQRKPR